MIHDQIKAALTENNDLLALFYERCVGFFEERTSECQGRKRQPSYALRLIMPGHPFARMVIKAEWVRRERRLDSGTLTIDVIWDQAEHGLCLDLYRSLRLCLMRDSFRLHQCWSSDRGVQSTQRLLATVRDFLDEPQKVFGLSQDNCCVCGKDLLDDHSRARGIGPDCLKKSEWLKGIFVPKGWMNTSEQTRRQQVPAGGNESVDERDDPPTRTTNVPIILP
jgi:hypothetical protein